MTDLEKALESFRAWRDSTVSTFPLDDASDGEELRLLHAFDAAFTLGYVRAQIDARDWLRHEDTIIADAYARRFTGGMPGGA